LQTLHYFSSVGYIVKKTRTSLDPKTVNILMCLWDWCRWHLSSNFRYISMALNGLVIPLCLLNSTTYVIFF